MNSSLFLAIPPPEPPNVNEGLTIIGKDKDLETFSSFLRVLTTNLLGESRPIFSIEFLNNSLLSAFSMTDCVAPINSTLYFAKIPFFFNSIDKFNAVCPPIVESNASGLSLEIIFSKKKVFNGSMYVLCVKLGSVIIVAGFEFTKITLYPSSLRALHARAPE